MSYKHIKRIKSEGDFFGLSSDANNSEDYKFTQDLSDEIFELSSDSYSKKERLEIYDKLYKDALIRKAVDIPVDDSLSEWRTLEDEKLKELDDSLNLKNLFIEAGKVIRKYGEVLLLPVLISTQRNIITKIPLNLSLDKVFEQYKNISVLKILTVEDFDKDTNLETDILKDNYGMPKWYSYNSGKRVVRLHPSRVLHIENSKGAVSFIDTLLPYMDHYTRRNNEVTRATEEANWIILKTNFKLIRQDVVSRLSASTKLPNSSFAVQGIIANNEIVRSKVEDGIQNRLRHMRTNAHSSSAYAIDKEFEEIDQIEKNNISQMLDAAEKALQSIASIADVPMERFLGKRAGGVGGGSSTLHYLQYLIGFRTKLIGTALERIDEFLKKIYPQITSTNYSWNPTIIERIELKQDRTPLQEENNPGGFQKES